MKKILRRSIIIVLTLCIIVGSVLALEACNTTKENDSGNAGIKTDAAQADKEGTEADAAQANGESINAEAAQAEDESVKTDIAQVFIEVKGIISKEAYTEASIKIVDALGGSYQTIDDSTAKIRIRGNSTAALQKIPYNIKLSSSQSVLGMKSSKKWCLLANFLDTSLMRNKLAYDFAKNIGLAYSCESRYVDIWMNGEFQGNYLITMPADAGKNKVDIDTDKNEYLLELELEREEENKTYIYTHLCRLKLNSPETLTEEQDDWLTEFLRDTEAAMKSKEFSAIEKYVDVDSFIDFYIVQELFKNLDVHTSSAKFYIKNDKLYAGPLWDCDLSSGNVALFDYFWYYLAYNNFGGYGNNSGNSYEGFWALNGGRNQDYDSSWIGRLMKSEEFKKQLYKRYMELQDQIENLYEDNTVGTNQMDLLLNQYGKSFTRDNEKWPPEQYRYSELYRTNETTFEDSVSFLRSWLKNRNLWLKKALKE